MTLLAAAACGGSSSSSGASKSLTVLFGTSGAAETQALKDAANAWSARSGIKVNVRPATDFAQELAQGFTAGDPPDIFYVSPDQFTELVDNHRLDPYAGKLPNANRFYPELRDTYTSNNVFYAAPKDVGVMALAINTKLWKAAGLTDADIPKTWDQLHADAKKLSKNGVTGLTIAPDFGHVGPFLLENGGWLVNGDQTAAEANSPQNVQALDFLKSMLADGSMKLSADLGVGWPGEALGKQKAAMVVEGPWLDGAMKADYPNVQYRVVDMPAGPAGPGTMFFTNAWGIAAQSKNTTAAVDFVKFLTTPQQQMSFAKSFGPIPSLSSAADQYKSTFPEKSAYLDGIDHAKTYPTLAGFDDVMNDMNAQLSKLATSDPKTILDSVQQNLGAITQ
ncbi:MAG: extracellular solute-binding protein [Acidimicrobiaceae bacterium]|nr:extracellular solute-binding protein [Acidimicrobiaceae bacterium]